ncbi:hypothetical protein FRC12_008573 [Ceratobasidium sp. 428]|nr:hypothetical protein FRC12_008573 [Ceratobasidium sp. 428]
MPAPRPTNPRTNRAGANQGAQAPRPERPAEEQGEDVESCPIATDARQLTRMVAMIWNPRAVVNAGYELRRAADDGSEQAIRDAASATQKLNHKLYDKLNELQPDLFDQLADKDGHFARYVRDRLSRGRSGAKAEDNHKVKNALPHLVKDRWLPSLIDVAKKDRGLAHDECAKWLSPNTINWDDADAHVLLDSDDRDPEDPRKGLMRNKLLIDVAKVLLKSPTSVIPSATVRPNAVRRGRKGVGAKYQLTEITPAFLAYVAVLTRFAVSSEETYSDDGGTFNYAEFYKQLREFLEMPKYRRHSKVLINFWNKEIFPDVARGANGGVIDNDIRAGGTLELIDAQYEGEDDDDEGEGAN